jgi:hypothetical protein
MPDEECMRVLPKPRSCFLWRFGEWDGNLKSVKHAKNAPLSRAGSISICGDILVKPGSVICCLASAMDSGRVACIYQTMEIGVSQD